MRLTDSGRFDIAIAVLFFIWGNVEHSKVIAIIAAVFGCLFMVIAISKLGTFHDS